MTVDRKTRTPIFSVGLACWKRLVSKASSFEGGEFFTLFADGFTRLGGGAVDPADGSANALRHRRRGVHDFVARDTFGHFGGHLNVFGGSGFALGLFVDGDERRMLREEFVLEAEDGDGFGVGQSRHFRAGPEGGDGGVRGLIGREIDHDSAFKGVAAGVAEDADFATGGAGELARQHERFGIEKIRDALGINLLDGEIAPVDADVGEERGVDAFVEAFGGGGTIVLQADVLDFAAATGGHFVEQMTVDGAADAEGEDAGVGVTLDFGEDFGFVADVAIGHKADDPEVLLRGGGGEGGADGLHHFGAAAGLAELQELLGEAEVFLRGGDGAGKSRCVSPEKVMRLKVSRG